MGRTRCFGTSLNTRRWPVAPAAMMRWNFVSPTKSSNMRSCVISSLPRSQHWSSFEKYSTCWPSRNSPSGAVAQCSSLKRTVALPKGSWRRGVPSEGADSIDSPSETSSSEITGGVCGPSGSSLAGNEHTSSCSAVDWDERASSMNASNTALIDADSFVTSTCSGSISKTAHGFWSFFAAPCFWSLPASRRARLKRNNCAQVMQAMELTMLTVNAVTTKARMASVWPLRKSS
mmetsp:Transcript_53990/g.106571  ORF Transcript_53990/g.106571 Transcript_53990/m.106571 type:complete len:232 (-) Transcript_53990:97-792(-)